MNDQHGATAVSESAAPKTSRSVSFSARDLVNVAMFSVLYFVIVLAVSMIGVVSPLVMLATLPLAPIAAGIPYMLFLTRVRHPGMVTLFGVVVALLYMMTGHPWQSTVLTIALAVIAEFVLRAGRYRSREAAIATYVVFSGWFIGPWIPFLLNPDAYLNSPAMQGMGTAYVHNFRTVVTVPALSIMMVAVLICGFLGALLGTSLLRKHFRKAGLA